MAHIDQAHKKAISEKLQIGSFDLGAAIQSAAEALPEGCLLRLDIEKHGCAARLVLSDGAVADVDRETLVDEIEALVEIAIKRSTEPKPLTRE